MVEDDKEEDDKQTRKVKGNYRPTEEYNQNST